MSRNSADRRVRRTRSLLTEALLSLIEERPLEEITVQEITDKADVARATFYLHYSDKHDLLWQSLEEFFQQLSDTMGQINSETLLISGKPLSYAAFNHIYENATLYRQVLNDARFTAQLHEYLAQQSERHHAPLRRAAPRVKLPPEYTANFLAGALIGVARWWLANGLQQTPEEIAYRFTALAAPGVLASLGLHDFTVPEPPAND